MGRPRQRLFLARDRFGEKPLFIREDVDGGSASPPRSRRCCSSPGEAEVNLSAVWDYLGTATCRGRARSPRHPQAGAGNERRLGEGQAHRAPLRVAPTASRSRNQPERPRGAGVLERLDEAVKMQMVSDVPSARTLGRTRLLDHRGTADAPQRQGEDVLGCFTGAAIASSSRGVVARHFSTDHTS